MQFMFLMYHYYHAEEVYNAIRIMITCYVWMTGFGNFSFFYIKQVRPPSCVSVWCLVVHVWTWMIDRRAHAADRLT